MILYKLKVRFIIIGIAALILSVFKNAKSKSKIF